MFGKSERMTNIGNRFMVRMVPNSSHSMTIVVNESSFNYTIIQKTLKKALFRGRGTGNQGNKHYLCMILCTPACVCRSYCLWACVASAE